MSGSRLRQLFTIASLVGVFAMPSPSSAFTVDTSAKTATTNGSRDDVQNALDASAVTDGWTVVIPGGSFSWSSTVSIVKGIHLRGAGVGSTTIAGEASPRISLTKQAGHIVEISAMSFASGSMSIFVGGDWTARPFVLHDCAFNGGLALRVEANGGLIYNCTFNGSFKNEDEAVQHKQPGDVQSWSTADTMGTKDTTGERNLYIEDCTFNALPLQGFDFDDASRVVIRHSRFVNSAITSHGVDTSAVGMRHFEVYDNIFDYTFDASDPNAQDVGYFLFIRGGTGVIANNQIGDIKSQQWGDKSEVILTVFSITRNGGQLPCQTRYPAFRQVGQGFNGSSYFTDPVYIWGNTGQGNYNSPELLQYAPDECGNGQHIEDYLKLNRDYFLSARPGYNKYPYPHPLRTGVKPPSKPATPGNVHVVR